MPKIIGQEKIESAGALKHSVEASEKATEVPGLGELAGLQKILSPQPEPKLPKVPRALVITPKRSRMASVLDVVLESTRVSTPAPAKKTAEAATVRIETEAGPQCPLKQSLLELSRVLNKDLQTSVWFWKKKTRPRRLNLLLPKHLLKSLTLLFDMLRVKGSRKMKLQKPNTMPEN
jgi:hypothetical protein